MPEASVLQQGHEHTKAGLAFVLIDGVGDVGIQQLGFKTPLQQASIPFLDAVSGAGLNGLLDPVEPGLACGSDTAHLSILGYNPRKYYHGRGAFESMGAGVPMGDGDIAFKSNFATWNPHTGIVERRRADRRFEILGPLFCSDLDGLPIPGHPGHALRVRYATEHRCGVVIAGPGLCDRISSTDPLKDGLPLQEAAPLDDSREAATTAAVVNAASKAMHALLQGHPLNADRVAQGKPPANIVLLRGCGIRIAVQPFEERWGLRACMVAPTRIIAGLGMSLGIHLLDVPAATGDYRTCFEAKAEAVAAALISGEYDFAFLHVKAVDDAGHDKAPALKVGYLEAVDAMVGQLIKRLGQAGNSASQADASPQSGTAMDASQAGSGAERQYALCITGDHSTPAVFGDHSHEPVPFALAHVRHIIRCLGGAAEAAAIPLTHIEHPADGLQRYHPSVPEQPPISGDSVACFDELSAASGWLGRFPGSQVMPLIRQFSWA